MSATLLTGDCIEQMRTLPDESVHSIVTDPPYELTSARPGGRSEATRGAVMGGFMGMQWDGTGVAFRVDVWRECLRVLKPGGYLLAFGGTRTYHRMACAIEDAGFEIRDQIQWIYGSGFPKCKSTALKPAHEPIAVARKPLAARNVATNVAEHGTGALNIDGCRVGADVSGRWPANVIHDGSEEVMCAFPPAPGQLADASDAAEQHKTKNVYGPMRRGQHEPSANNDNAGVVGFKMKPGARRLDAGSAARFFYCAKASKADRNAGGVANKHPTVKPTELMRYLCRLVTPSGGTVLDPFAGSGSTGRGALLEGLSFVGIELNPEYVELTRQRLAPLLLKEAA